MSAQKPQDAEIRTSNSLYSLGLIEKVIDGSTDYLMFDCCHCLAMLYNDLFAPKEAKSEASPI